MADGGVRGELFGRHEARDGVMLPARLQILANGHKVDVGATQIVHQLQDFVALLAEADHDAGFGEKSRVELLRALQQPD